MAPSRFPLRTKTALAIIALAVLLLRVGSLWTERIDWDEWSFILMGADVARGHLPFVHQFDLKPPLIFFVFGGVIAVFGKSLVAIRLLGALSVFACAAFVFLIGCRATGRWPALMGALLFATLASAPFGLATSSELPAIAFLSAAIWRLARSPLRNHDAAVAGILVALAVLTRTNLAVVAVVLGLLLLIVPMVVRAQVPRTAVLAYAAAGLVPPLMLLLTYAAAGELATLKLAMLDVPLAYSGQLGIAEVAREHFWQFYYTAQGSPLLYLPPVLLAALGVVLKLVRLRSREDSRDRWLLTVLFATTSAVACSLLIGGAAYPHYWLQLLPFVGVFSAIGLAALARLHLVVGALATALAIIPLALGLSSSLAKAPASYASPHPIAAAAAYIRANGGPHPQVWALHEHLVLWYLDAPQLSRAGVHPDNLARRAIIDTLARHRYVGPDEVGRLLALRPQFVVTDAGGKGLAWVRDDGREVDRWLAANYRQTAHFGEVLVYRRR